jgi:hypothetical protein
MRVSSSYDTVNRFEVDRSKAPNYFCALAIFARDFVPFVRDVARLYGGKANHENETGNSLQVASLFHCLV